ncbi:alpha/beta hydrolase [Amphritea pacifica]|uniref:alpha/beta hydrolase n=1 Tax=Amphritea pacifica TaxID=2811233 RepID=UPI0019669DE8|nr:alpha/beta hydrolase [Amphritea pacifica]MBN1007051.1 alpha/beta hydrolase [Amphritea pacifica]
MLDLQIKGILEQAAAAGAPDFADLPPAAGREVYSQILAATDVAVADGVNISDLSIPGPGGELALRCYRPEGADELAGAVLYLHGGGFVVGCPRDYDGVVSQLSRLSGCLIVQVDYRLAPEHPYPAAVEDCYAALCWLADAATELGVTPGQIALAGDSAGANLAAVCALLARDNAGPSVRQQTLIYPTASGPDTLYDSYDKYGEGYTLTNRSMVYFMEHYLSGSAEPVDFRLAPLDAENLSDLPPALIQVAGFDPLRDEGIAYAEALQQAGCSVSLIEYPQLVHGYISMSGAVAAAGRAVDEVAAAWRQVFSSVA